MSYTPPLRDIQFVLHEMLDASRAYAEMPDFKDVNIELMDRIAEEAGRFASQVLAPLNAIGDEVGCKFDGSSVQTPPGFVEAYRKYIELGWPGLACAPSFGGQGLPQVMFAMLWEMLVATNHSWTMYAGLTMCAHECLTAHASPSLKEKYLPHIVSGEWTVTMDLSEPQAGTDLGLIRMRAEEDGGESRYRLTGTKIFVSAGDHDLADNIIHLVLARTKGAVSGSKGLSLFLVPKHLTNDDMTTTRNLVVCERIEKKMGLTANATCVMNFDGAVGWLIGELNHGLACLFVMMNSARLQCGMQGLGHAEAALQASSAYARDRLQGRAPARGVGVSRPADPIAMHPAVQRLLLTQRAYVEGARAMAYWTGLMIDTSKSHPGAAMRARAEQLVSLITPIVKAALTEIGFQGANLGLQVFGGHGYVKDVGIEQHVRDSRAGLLYEGTNEIQAIDLLTRKVLSDDGTQLEVLLQLIDDEARNAAALTETREFGDRLELCVREVRWATRWLVEAREADSEAPYRVASDYLELLAHCVFAWLWAWSARTAAGRADDRGFYKSKLATAKYYFAYLLPRMAQHLAVIREAATPLEHPAC